MTNLLRIVGILGLVCISGAQSTPSNQPLTKEMGNGFETKFVQANGTRLHYVRGGSGPVLILLHGFPEDWFAFRFVMPVLSRSFTVLAVDLRGVGESAPAATGYDVANLAEDLHQLIVNLGLKDVYVFGHDIGGMVAYAFARRYSSMARGTMIFDSAFPGLDPWQEMVGRPTFWHVGFHQTPLPEKLVAGRQTEYFRYFLSQVSNDVVLHYAHSYRDPDHLQAAFETYRAFPTDERFFSSQHRRLDLPIVIGSGEHDAVTQFVPRIAKALQAHGCTNVKAETIKGAAHYVAEEAPEALAGLIERYASDLRIAK